MTRASQQLASQGSCMTCNENQLYVIVIKGDNTEVRLCKECVRKASVVAFDEWEFYGSQPSSKITVDRPQEMQITFDNSLGGKTKITARKMKGEKTVEVEEAVSGQNGRSVTLSRIWVPIQMLKKLLAREE